MSELVLVLATFANGEEAERIARTVVDERLAACANLLAPCTSIYRWQGEVERASEVPALFKTTPDQADPLRTRIAALHSYDLPAIESWPASASAEVLDWVRAETR